MLAEVTLLVLFGIALLAGALAIVVALLPPKN